jgi:glycosyltransferase involved in cell wall biosynthesis
VNAESKIHIMHIVQSWEGVQRYLFMFLRNMNRYLFTQTLICTDYYSEKDYKSLVENIEHIDMRREISPMADIIAIKKIRRLIKRYNPDIIYCHSSKGGALGRIASLGFNRKIKIVYNPHGWAFNMRGSKIKMLIYVLIERILALYTHNIIVISKAEKESALKNRICAKEKLILIYNGIEISAIQTIIPIEKINIGMPSDAFVIGMVGRISEQKAPDIFIEAAKLIKERISNAFFVIVGDGVLRSTIEEKSKEYGIFDSLIITNWIDNVIPYVKIFDIALLLSRWEGFGLALAEYMAAEKPIIATNIDAIPELIENNRNGLLIPVDDACAVCDAVLTLKDNSQLREKFIHESLEIVNAKFDIKRVIIEHEKLFQHLIK